MGFIYWIASYPKSGNTWTRAFLTSLIAGDLGDKLGRLQEIIPDENSGQYYRPYLDKPVAQASNVELALARPQAHRRMAKAAQNFLLLKTHAMVAVHNGTRTITPDVTAGAIYLLRNPLDVAVSYADFRSRNIDLTIALMNTSGRELDRPANGAYELVGSWKENVESWTKPHDSVAVVRYEDLLADPHASFRRMIRLLRMDVDDARIDQAIEAASFDNLRSREEAGGFSERPPQAEMFFRSGRAGEWRERLSEEQVAAVVRPNAETMKRFGYWLDEFDELLKGAAVPAPMPG